jgi:phosphoglycolate phosphatase-like HAD superfamily hydrolase
MDGTLLNTAERQYAVFRDAVKDVAPAALDECPDHNRFWERKRAGDSTTDLLPSTLDDDAVAAVEETWLSWIETREYLRLDEPIPGAPGALADLASLAGSVLLVTHRSDVENARWEIERYGFDDHVTAIYIIPHGSESKAARLQREEASFASTDLVVGDSETDIRTAAQLGVRSAAVTTGVRSVDLLCSHNPTVIFPDLSAVVEAIRIGDL